ncbi:hypothetical protein [Emticicia sp. TH156]|uniref:hypothetical protein n=1 Tax=Emticicia sp. TH156 TaxID=2067454 RepID=UPI000C78F702|nr:hypothetical protein [Emticicia sp. TH156]PLK42165.1 hypothetical protein C0V77_22370 [Emticicia sp. TH156]
MAKSKHYYIRKSHRYLGVILGIQFSLWTLGGLYFSWSDMDEIHGDHQKAHIHPIEGNIKLANLSDILQKIRAKDTVNYILDTRLIQILGVPYYQISYSKEHDGAKKIQLANAISSELRAGLSEKEATKVAQLNFSDDARIKSVEYLTTINNHHEYRGQPLPAYAITFEHPSNTTVYVSNELGTVQKFRNNKWRIFDFLWMLHTMDYQGRDNISNWLLRAFSVFGLLTILSGFLLFFISFKRAKRI